MRPERERGRDSPQHWIRKRELERGRGRKILYQIEWTVRKRYRTNAVAAAAATQSEVNHGNLRDQMGSDRSLPAVLPIFRVYSFAFAFPSPDSAQTSLVIRIPGGERREQERASQVASQVRKWGEATTAQKKKETKMGMG